MQDQQIVDYGARFLRGFCLGMPFLAIDFLAVGVFQACGLGKNAFLFAILRKVVLEIPALFLLNALFPLYGLAYAQFAAELVLAIAAVIVLARLFRRLERRYQPKGSRILPFALSSGMIGVGKKGDSSMASKGSHLPTA